MQEEARKAIEEQKDFAGVQIVRGTQAQQILSNPFFVEFIDRAMKGYFKEFLEGSIRDDQARLIVTLSARILKEFKNTLERAARSGGTAAKALEEMNKLTQEDSDNA